MWSASHEEQPSHQQAFLTPSGDQAAQFVRAAHPRAEERILKVSEYAGSEAVYAASGQAGRHQYALSRAPLKIEPWQAG